MGDFFSYFSALSEYFYIYPDIYQIELVFEQFLHKWANLDFFASDLAPTFTPKPYFAII